MKPLTYTAINYFHDWVSKNILIGDNFEIALEILGENNYTHIAEMTFTNIRNLEFIYWTFDEDQKKLNKYSELKNWDLITTYAKDRWLQSAKQNEGMTEIEFIGGNEDQESFVVLFNFKYDNLKIKVNGKIFENEEDLGLYLRENK